MPREMKRDVRALLAPAAAALALSAGCASHNVRPEVDPQALAHLDATMRLVGAETTWVAHGAGYELIGRTRVDLAAVKPQLDGEAAAFRKVFPKDTLVPIVVTTRRITPPDKPYVGPAPVPNSVRGEVVEIVLPDAHAKPEDDKNSAWATIPGGSASLNSAMRGLPAMRAWLSAHASSLTKTPGSNIERDGETEDHRIAAWAGVMIPLLGADSLVDRFTTALAAHPESLYPLSSYFTMERPSSAPAVAERENGNRSGDAGRGGASGGGMGGMGRGGMGRGGMGGGRGGTSRGGGGDRGGGSERQAPGLRGASLFDAQSLVLGKFLVARDGYDFI
ncbi:MAG TPA: hypothetical protein VHV78_01990, partial [Gemmatimonadaceae bacterium]|nr:hypothetical protein [Gemmatimonadaceae bacterium]